MRLAQELSWLISTNLYQFNERIWHYLKNFLDIFAILVFSSSFIITCRLWLLIITHCELL